MPSSRFGGAPLHRIPRSIPVLAAVLLAAVPPASADALTRDAAIARALAASPTLEARALGIRREEALESQARRRPNPELELELEDLSGSLPGFRRSETTLLLRQPLGPSGQGSARRAAARAALDRARSDAGAARADIVREVTLLFTEGLVARERLRLLEESLAVADSIVITVEQKVRLGATLASETARSRAARSLAAIERDEALRDLDRRRAELAAFWGGDADDVDGFDGTLDAAPAPAPADSILAHHPLVSAWRGEARVRAAEARLARSEGRWAPTIAAGYRFLEGGEAGTFLVGVSTPLPLFDTNRDAAVAAELGAREAERDGDAVRRSLEREAGSLLRRRASRRATLEDLRTTLLPASAEAYAGVDLAYRLGRLAYLDLLDARRTVVEARLLELDALGDLRRLDAELEWLLAGETAAAGAPDAEVRP
jgi:cobalt-zinc-cadmium efflux system outer membrane protein